MPSPWEKYAAQSAPSSDAENMQDLAGRLQNNPVSPWEKYGNQNIVPASSYGESAMRGGAQGLLMGYEPQVVGGAKALVGGDYSQARNQEIEANQNAEKSNPKTYGAAQFAGSIPSTVGAGLLVPEAEIPTLAGRMAKAATVGGAIGAVGNPGDTTKNQGDSQIEERLKNAALGSSLGAGGQAIGETISGASDAIKDWAGIRATKAAGFIQSSLKKLSNNMTPQKLGQDAMDMGLIKPGDSVDSIAEKANTAVDDIGNKIGQIYSDARDKIKDLGDKVDIDKKKFMGDLVDSVMKPGTMPELDQGPYVDRMNSLIKEIGEKDISNPEQLFQVKRALQQKVKWWKATGEMPENEKGYVALQRTVNNAIGDVLDTLGKVSESPSQKQTLIDLNKRFAIATTIADSAEQGSLREQGNRWLTPSSYGTGLMGGVAGAAMGTSPVEKVGYGLLGAGAGLANKAAMKYGNSIIAPAAYGAAKLASKAASKPGAMGLLGGQLSGSSRR